MAAPAVERPTMSTNSKLLAIFGAGAAVALLLGVYADAHTPTAEQPYTLFFSGTIQLKTWLATAAVVLAVVQVLLAMRMYGKLHWPKTAPSWLGDAHRLIGIVAFLLTLPVAYHCLWALGFQSGDSTRVLVHSVVGLLLLRDLRGEGPVRARGWAAGLDAPGRRRPRVRVARRHLPDEQPLVLHVVGRAGVRSSEAVRP